MYSLAIKFICLSFFLLFFFYYYSLFFFYPGNLIQTNSYLLKINNTNICLSKVKNEFTITTPMTSSSIAFNNKIEQTLHPVVIHCQLWASISFLKLAVVLRACLKSNTSVQSFANTSITVLCFQTKVYIFLVSIKLSLCLWENQN